MAASCSFHLHAAVVVLRVVLPDPAFGAVA
jgi:hypothetical protein